MNPCLKYLRSSCKHFAVFGALTFTSVFGILEPNKTLRAYKRGKGYFYSVKIPDHSHLKKMRCTCFFMYGGQGVSKTVHFHDIQFIHFRDALFQNYLILFQQVLIVKVDQSYRFFPRKLVLQFQIFFDTLDSIFSQIIQKVSCPREIKCLWITYLKKIFLVSLKDIKKEMKMLLLVLIPLAWSY